MSIKIPHRIVVAPSGFKESLSPEQVCAAVATGIRRVLPGAIIASVPLVDGGEGSAVTIAHATVGELVSARVSGPVGQFVDAQIAKLGGSSAGTWLVEMAAAAGLRLVPSGLRNPGATTTYGVGEMIKVALDGGAKRIIVGCGDSGTSDGGAGALVALGARLRDASGLEVLPDGDHLLDVARIDIGGLDLLTGPGTGASGGLGAGLAAGAGAELRSRFDVLLNPERGGVDLDAQIASCDLVITAEGSVDYQTPRGKIPAEVARRAKLAGKPVIALAGSIGRGASDVHEVGIDAVQGIIPVPMDLAEAVERAPELVAAAAERALRLVLIGAVVAAA